MKFKFICVIWYLSLSAIYINLDAQEISYAEKEYIDADGTIYWNKNLPVYLSISPYPNAQGHLLKSTNPDHSNPIYLDTEGPNYIRTKYAVDKNSKKIASPLVEVIMPIVADGSGPESSITFLNAERHRSGGIQYYGPSLTVSITSADKLSGLELLNYKLDSEEYQSVSGEIAVASEGEHTLTYYGVDRVGNKEEDQVRTFIVDLTPPSVTHNINGFADQNVIARTSKIYFTATDGISGLAQVYYRFDDEEFRPYNGNNVRFSYLDDGDHTLEYYAVDNVDNETARFSTDLYFDKTAPLTASDILGDRFVVNDKIYFSGRTKMKLTAVDNKIGVKDILYSIDRDEFKTYDQPFYLPSIPGEHRIRYYSEDRLSNKPSGSEAYKHNISLVYLDLTGPSITHRIRGPFFKAAGVQYISPKTEIVVQGNDGESGLQYMTTSIDGAAAETVYNEPITISSSGQHEIEMFGYDNVNNRNVGKTVVYVDATPPTIIENFSTRAVGSDSGLQVYPPYVNIFLAATDEIVGNDKIYYSINGGRERLYSRPIANLRQGSEYTVVIRAIDMVGNESLKEVKFKTAEE